VIEFPPNWATGVAFVTSGPLPRGIQPHQLRRFRRLIAVDGGLRHCQKLGLTPDLAIGDFDSVQLPAHPDFPVIGAPRDKDLTDLEMALEQELDGWGAIFGGIGARADHTATHLLLLQRHPGKLFIMAPNELTFAFEGTFQFSCHPGQLVSLIPLYGPSKLRTEGLHWELRDEQLDLNRIGISNRCTGPHCTVHAQGTILCSLHRPARKPSTWLPE
jgi:thiamine pyrophosphokinase